MNLQDDTIQLLVDLVEKEQRRLDQFQPDSQDYARRFHALMDRFADDQPLTAALAERLVEPRHARIAVYDGASGRTLAPGTAAPRR